MTHGDVTCCLNGAVSLIWIVDLNGKKGIKVKLNLPENGVVEVVLFDAWTADTRGVQRI